MPEIEKERIVKTTETTPEKSVIHTETIAANTWTDIFKNEGRLIKIRYWQLKCRTSNAINYAFVPASANPRHHMTLAAGAVLSENTRPEYLCAKCASEVVIEFEYWLD